MVMGCDGGSKAHLRATWSYLEPLRATESHWKQLKKALGATFTCQINRGPFLYALEWCG